MNVLDLFSGIGGMALGLERARFNISCFCEIGDFQRMVLQKHWKTVPIINDINEIDYIEGIDLICGGFPCQSFSTAARGRNIKELDLWPSMFKVIWRHMPKWVIAENVTEKAISEASHDLEVLNYNVWTRRISAADCGAPHKRNRWWLCAHANSNSEFHSYINAEVEKLPKLCHDVWFGKNHSRTFRVSNGVPNRLDRVRALGNALVPYIPMSIGLGIKEYLKKESHNAGKTEETYTRLNN